MQHFARSVEWKHLNWGHVWGVFGACSLARLQSSFPFEAKRIWADFVFPGRQIKNNFFHEVFFSAVTGTEWDGPFLKLSLTIKGAK